MQKEYVWCKKDSSATNTNIQSCQILYIVSGSTFYSWKNHVYDEDEKKKKFSFCFW